MVSGLSSTFIGVSKSSGGVKIRAVRRTGSRLRHGNLMLVSHLVIWLPVSNNVRRDLRDLASVSPIVRSVSDSVRSWSPMFSPIVRRKVPLIARPPHFDCASLHVERVWPVPDGSLRHQYGPKRGLGLSTGGPQLGNEVT